MPILAWQISKEIVEAAEQHKEQNKETRTPVAQSNAKTLDSLEKKGR